MKTNSIHITFLTLLCTAVAGFLIGCADDDGPQAPAKVRELSLSMSPRQFEALATRADDASVADPYELYDYDTNLAKIDQIQAYLTATDEETKHTVVSAPFTYKTADKNWASRVPLVDGTYYIYGYMPSEGVARNVEVKPLNDDYKNGAVLTLDDLNAVSPEDICIIVGAEGYGSDTKSTLSNPSDMTSRRGHFDYSTSDGDKLFLLADHLYAGIEFRLKLNADYSKLRQIKINKITLTPDIRNGAVVEKVKATVTVDARVDGGSTTVEFETENGTTPKSAVLYSGEGRWLTDTDQAFLACFCPATNTRFVLQTEYDVYGRDGKNLIRGNQKAENYLTLQYGLSSGQKHIINITVNPTYLYVLSDPDLDNPEFTIGSP